MYVLYDARAYGRPQWLLNKFVDKHTEIIENAEGIQPYYEVYSAPFEPGEVCLGGNDADGESRATFLLSLGCDPVTRSIIARVRRDRDVLGARRPRRYVHMPASRLRQQPYPKACFAQSGSRMIRRARRSPAATLTAARTGSASTKRLECVAISCWLCSRQSPGRQGCRALLAAWPVACGLER